MAGENGGPTDVDMSAFGLGTAPNGANAPKQTGANPPEPDMETPNNGLGTGVEPNVEALDAAIEKAFKRSGEVPGAVDDPDDTDTTGQTSGEDAGESGSPAADTPPSTDEELGSGDDDDEDDDGTGATGDSAISPAPVDFATQFQSIYHRPPTADDVQNMLGVLSTLGNLPPDKQAAIDAYINGTAETLGTPEPPTPPAPDPLAEEYADDPIYQRITQLQQEQARLEQQVNLQAQDRVAAQQQVILTGIESATTDFAKANQLSEEDAMTLQGAVARSRTFPQFMQMANGDPVNAMQQALSYHYWNTPEFRDQAIQREVESRTAKTQTHEERKAKAASVTGTGGNGASRVAPPKRVLSSDDRWGAVADDIRELQSNN